MLAQMATSHVEEFTDYDSVVVFLAVARAYIAKFFVTSHYWGLTRYRKTRITSSFLVLGS